MTPPTDIDHTAAPLAMLPTLGELRRLALRLDGSGGPMLTLPPTRLPAGGTEPTGLRDYVPGDDVRRIDWTICARRDEVLTRTYEGRMPSRVELLIDCSRSMDWPADSSRSPSEHAVGGGLRRTKLALARRIATVLACAALGTEETLSITAFAGRLGQRLPAARGLGALERVVRFVAALPVVDEPTRLDHVADQLVRRRVRPGIAVVVSDLLDPAGFGSPLDRLRYHGYTPRVVQVYDPSEADPRLLGEVELADVESSATVPATVTESVATHYRRGFSRLLSDVRAYSARWGMPWGQFSTTADDAELVRTLLGVSGAAPSPSG